MNNATNEVTERVLERLREIEQEADKKRCAELNTLEQAVEEIDERIATLARQRKTLTDAISQISGRKVSIPHGGRMDYTGIRSRIARWLQRHPGEKFGARALLAAFPELMGKHLAVIMTPLVAEGSVQREGQRGDMVYFVKGQRGGLGANMVRV